MENLHQWLREGNEVYGIVRFMIPSDTLDFYAVDIERDDGGWAHMDSNQFEDGKVSEGDRVKIEMKDGKVKGTVVAKKIVHRGMGSDLMALCGKMEGISGHDQVRLSYVDKQVTCVKCLHLIIEKLKMITDKLASSNNHPVETED